MRASSTSYGNGVACSSQAYAVSFKTKPVAEIRKKRRAATAHEVAAWRNVRR